QWAAVLSPGRADRRAGCGNAAPGELFRRQGPDPADPRPLDRRRRAAAAALAAHPAGGRHSATAAGGAGRRALDRGLHLAARVWLAGRVAAWRCCGAPGAPAVAGGAGQDQREAGAGLAGRVRPLARAARRPSVGGANGWGRLSGGLPETDRHAMATSDQSLLGLLIACSTYCGKANAPWWIAGL